MDYDKLLLCCKNLLKDLRESPEDRNPIEVFKSYAKSDKWNIFFRENHIIFNVLIFSRIYSKEGLKRYIQERDKSIIDTDTRFYEVVKAYLIGFDVPMLKKIGYQKDHFIQFYMKQMEDFIEGAKKKIEDKEAEELLKEEQRQASIQLLKDRLLNLN